MNAKTLIAIVVAVVGFAPLAFSGEGEGSERADKATFNTLMQKLRSIDSDYARTLGQAVKEARAGNGEASLGTKARLLALRDQRDGVTNRLMLISLRHGWEVPDLNPPTDAKSAPVPTENDRVFGAADHIIKAKFEDEAVKIAGAITTFPVVSIKKQDSEVN